MVKQRNVIKTGSALAGIEYVRVGLNCVCVVTAFRFRSSGRQSHARTSQLQAKMCSLV